jgi:hypothetical protein
MSQVFDYDYWLTSRLFARERSSVGDEGFLFLHHVANLVEQ